MRMKRRARILIFILIVVIALALALFSVFHYRALTEKKDVFSEAKFVCEGKGVGDSCEFNYLGEATSGICEEFDKGGLSCKIPKEEDPLKTRILGGV